MIFSIIKFVAGLFVLAIILGLLRTWQMEHSSDQARFTGGTVPNPPPDGLYSGSLPGHKVSWLGKKFDAKNATGINVFDDGGGVKGERYPFKTSIGKGIRDKNIDVVKIDYNMEGNPFWLRIILDEIVEVAPGQYLGKLHIKIAGFPFTLAYFELKK